MLLPTEIQMRDRKTTFQKAILPCLRAFKWEDFFSVVRETEWETVLIWNAI